MVDSMPLPPWITAYVDMADEGKLKRTQPKLVGIFQAVEPEFLKLNGPRAEIRYLAMRFAQCACRDSNPARIAFHKKALGDFAKAAGKLVVVLSRAGPSGFSAAMPIIRLLQSQAELEDAPDWKHVYIYKVFEDEDFWKWLPGLGERAALQLKRPAKRPKGDKREGEKPAALLDIVATAWRVAGKRPGYTGDGASPFERSATTIFKAAGLKLPPSKRQIMDAVGRSASVT